jgi:TolB protein
MRMLRPFCIFHVAFCILIASCGPAPTPPDPAATAALLPREEPAPATPGPAPTVVSESGALPGRILFVKSGNLWLWQGDAGSQITASGDAAQPAWAPDGQRIAFVRRGESYSDLMLLRLPGGELETLTQNSSDEALQSFERIYDVVWGFYPAFAPDGAELAFVSQYGPPFGSPASDYHLALFTAPAVPGGARMLRYADDAGHVGRLAYAPDGSAIVFALGPAGDGVSRLFRYTPDSETAEPLAGAPEQSYDPAFSPDGRFLAFARRHEGGTDLFAMPALGGDAVALTTVGMARAPAFSPDGTQLAYLALAPGENSFDLWVVELRRSASGSLAAGEPRRITTGMAIDADSGIAWGR